MLYMQHDLRKNYLSATGAGDDKMRSDILMSEIAKLIVYRPSLVADVLKKTSPSFKNKNYNSHELASIVSTELYGNKKFADELAREIILSQISQSQKELMADGTNAGGVIAGVAVIAAGLGALFGGKKKEKADKERAEKELKANVTALGDMETKGVNWKRVMKWTIGIGLLVGGGFAIYKYSR